MSENKGTVEFNKTIKDYLDNEASNDLLFKEKYSSPDKSIEDCVKYIFSAVKESGMCGFTDEEVFGMAMHYYDEKDIKVGDISSLQVVVNHHVELTEEEIEQAKADAKERIYKEGKDKMHRPKKKKTVIPADAPPIMKLTTEAAESIKDTKVEEKKEEIKEGQQSLF